jgi:hypothetical protein
MHCRDIEDVASVKKLRLETAGPGGMLDAKGLCTAESDTKSKSDLKLG